MLPHKSDNLSFKKVFKESGGKGKIALIISTWFGTGLLPGPTGTYGTIAAVPLVLCLNGLGMVWRISSLMLLIMLAVWAAGLAEDILEQDDPSEVVIDEVAGFLFAMFLLGPGWPALCLGFIFFRFFDVVKPYPIKKLEKIKGGLGIVMDDILAGLYAAICVWIVLSFL
ncbi:MAG: phosphatidylglycerophosphatase A [Desulfobacterales bacterium]|nr:phosphatidylglycerophosphatase A [Desulfobacterales bacterium]